MPIVLYSSNRLEVLAENLAAVLGAAPVSPLEPEFILVQSRGMEHWVSLELARRLGVCANIRFPFPNHFVSLVFAAFSGAGREASSFNPHRLSWRIMDLLPGCLADPAFQALGNYLADDPSHLKKFQLAQRLAFLYDQYLLFRPEMVLDWEKGREDHWQARLWRKMMAAKPGPHRAALLQELRQAARRVLGRPDGLPHRVNVFGISALPPFHVEVLALLARHSPVHFFLLNPCREYWGDILSRRVEKDFRKRPGQRTGVWERPGEFWNPLLAAWGQMGREFLDLLLSHDPDWREDFRGPDPDFLLGKLQTDLLNLRAGSREQRCRLDPTDDSLQVHLAHSPMREVEILQDILLNLLDRDPTLRPRDILVMAPDIQNYAAFIKAVFSLPPGDGRHIPFSIADRGLQQESSLVRAFLSLLELPRTRMEAPHVLALLEEEALQRRFGFNRTDLGTIQRWVRDTRIRWGVDREYRERLGLPALGENTWENGLDRLLLAYALPAQGDRAFRGIWPQDRIEGSEALLLGRFLEFSRRLFRWTGALSRDRDPEAWADCLAGMLADFFLPPEHQTRAVALLQHQFQQLREIRQQADFTGEVGLPIVRDYLQKGLEQEGTVGGFITGGVTFCSLLPMRSIPFKVICLLGMNDDAYPRPTRTLGFDLLAARPRPGDRSRRKDDRYLFLEALVSAREKLIICYQGRSVQDNSLRPPSVLVSELLEAVDQGFELPEGKAPSRQIVRQHRLQAFHPDYFTGAGDLFSYSRENGQAARRLLQSIDPPGPFLPGGLSAPGPEWKNLAPEQLADFFSNPARYLLRKRLGLFLEEQSALVEATEPFSLEGLELYQVQQEMAERALRGEALGDCLEVFRTRGLLPQGTPGVVFFGEECRQALAFAAAVKAVTGDRRAETETVDLDMGGFKISGRLGGIFGSGLVHHRYARMKWKDRIQLWIQHLLFCRDREDPASCSHLICQDQGQGYFYEPEAAACLQVLLDIYWQGLTRPLPFFPRASWAYVDSLRSGKAPGKIREAVRQAWDNEFNGGDLSDPYLARCFQGADPFDHPDFTGLAEAVMGPLWDSENGRP
ncbi:MAG: exodeoxyribonuclease V subunit gamma [Desulfobacterota bacterium]|nr:exodeoxyribonuclease V subunit gamma [Thermodesulfobacteriota bacterium]